jgi:bifunctional DNase/RNase
MIPVSVEGVRRNFGISSVFMYTVTLVDEPGRRMFNLGVERHEALAIVAALHHLTLPRPQTINLLADTLAFHGVALDEIRLERMRRSPIFLVTATVVWRPSDNRTREQTRAMRPGDAIGLALLMECPLVLSDELAQQTGTTLADGKTPELYMIDELLKREGIVLPEGKKLRLGYSKTPLRDALVKEFKASLLGKAPPFPEEDLEQRKKDLLSFLLG